MIKFMLRTIGTPTTLYVSDYSSKHGEKYCNKLVSDPGSAMLFDNEEVFEYMEPGSFEELFGNKFEIVKVVT